MTNMTHLSMIIPLVLLLSYSGEKTAGMEGSTVDIDGARLWYRVVGEGQPLLLLHGGACDSRIWDFNIDALSDRFRVILLDLRGMGRSGSQTGEFSFLQDLEKFTDYIQLEKFYLAGLSLGSLISIDFALMHPEKVEKLILLSPWCRGFDVSESTVKAVLPIWQEGAKGNIEKAASMWLEDPQIISTKKYPAARKSIEKISYDNARFFSYRQQWWQWEWERSDHRLGEIKRPVFIIFGEDDVNDIQESAKKIHSLIPHSELFPVPEAGHMLNMEKPDLVNAEMIKFLLE